MWNKTLSNINVCKYVKLLHYITDYRSTLLLIQQRQCLLDYFHTPTTLVQYMPQLYLMGLIVFLFQWPQLKKVWFMHVVISMFFIVSTAPIPPVLSAVYSVDSTSITVIWNKPIEVNGALTIYTISYTVDDSSLMNVTVLFNGQQVGKIIF